MPVLYPDLQNVDSFHPSEISTIEDKCEKEADVFEKPRCRYKLAYNIVYHTTADLGATSVVSCRI